MQRIAWIGAWVLAVLLAAGAFALAALAVGAAVPTCQGEPATITAETNGPGPIVGSDGPDVIVGNHLDNAIFAGGGNDLVCGGEGNDAVFGGPGEDRLYGGAENDSLFGDDANDRLFGGGGNDRLAGDSSSADSGADRCDGGEGRRDALLLNGSKTAKATCETQVSLEKVIEQ